MTPAERAVIEAAQQWQDEEPQGERALYLTNAEEALVNALEMLSTPQPPAITVWRFEDAPAEYQALATTDEAEYVMFVPLGFEVPDWMRCVPAEMWHYSGPVDHGTVIIFAHA